MHMKIRSIVLTSLFAALIAAGSYLAIPIAPVPITLQTLFIITAGLLCGRKIGLSAVTVYLIAGAIGLPVFSGGTGGIAHLAGPTGGFLFGGLLSAYSAGLFADMARSMKYNKTAGESTLKKGDHSTNLSYMTLVIIGAFIGALVIYVIGIPWLKISLNLEWGKTFAVGMIPFIPGDILKTIAAIVLTKLFDTRIKSFLEQDTGDESA